MRIEDDRINREGLFLIPFHELAAFKASFLSHGVRLQDEGLCPCVKLLHAAALRAAWKAPMNMQAFLAEAPPKHDRHTCPPNGFQKR